MEKNYHTKNTKGEKKGKNNNVNNDNNNNNISNNNNNNNNNNKIIIMMITMINKKLELFGFEIYALAMTLLPRKLIRHIFWFP